jgi:hypothetical protein
MTKWANDPDHFTRISREIADAFSHRRIRIALKDGNNVSGQIMGFHVKNNTEKGVRPWPVRWQGNVRLQTESELLTIEYPDIERVSVLP